MKKLAKYIKREGIKQSFIADTMEVDRATFGAWVNGKRKVPPHYWRKLCELTKGHVTIDDFLNDAEGK